MTSLHDLQVAIQNYLHQKPSDAESLVVSSGKADKYRRLQIYQEAYHLRLQDNLAKQFPALCIYLGSEKFNMLSSSYIAAYPPQDFAIRIYGQYLMKFLNESPIYKDQPLICDLAKFEWTMDEVLDNSAESELLTQAELAEISPEQLADVIFELQPSLQAHKFKYDVPVLWQAIHKNANHKQVRVEEGEFIYALWRKELQPYFRKIPEQEFSLMGRLQQGASFAELAEHMLAFTSEDEASNKVAQILLQWLADGWLTKTYYFSEN